MTHVECKLQNYINNNNSEMQDGRFKKLMQQVKQNTRRNLKFNIKIRIVKSPTLQLLKKFLF